MAKVTQHNEDLDLDIQDLVPMFLNILLCNRYLISVWTGLNWMDVGVITLYSLNCLEKMANMQDSDINSQVLRSPLGFGYGLCDM